MSHTLNSASNGKSLTAVRAYFDRHLVGGAADTAGADLDGRFDVVQRLGVWLIKQMSI